MMTVDIGRGDRQLLDQQGVTLQALVRDQRFDCQVQLVREHWASVRRLWLDSATPPGATRIRSDLPDDFLERRLHTYHSVTCADLNEMAGRHIHPERVAILVVGDASQIEAPLGELDLGPVQCLDLDGNPR